MPWFELFAELEEDLFLTGEGLLEFVDGLLRGLLGFE
ncbi:hypothetical protein GvMRE_Ic1g122 [endosymbiont GvMRE of Glomus versiforme]|nr:hypothetical protein GvMRE_Ic1g122 [endosymbiont GvMRE of Glomus versiforme]